MRFCPSLDDEELIDHLEGFWRAIEVRMVGLPIHNPVLAVMVTPARRFGRFRFAAGGDALVHECGGHTRHGDRAATRRASRYGSNCRPAMSISLWRRWKTAAVMAPRPLFSPMDEFDDQVGAEAVAFAALDELLREAEPSENRCVVRQPGPTTSHRFWAWRAGERTMSGLDPGRIIVRFSLTDGVVTEASVRSARPLSAGVTLCRPADRTGGRGGRPRQCRLWGIAFRPR